MVASGVPSCCQPSRMDELSKLRMRRSKAAHCVIRKSSTKRLLLVPEALRRAMRRALGGASVKLIM